GKITKEDVGELEYGDYYFQETETIKGYVLNSTPITFQITENGKVIKLIAENDEEPGSVILHKYDNKRLKKLDGALFTLYKVPEGFIQKVGAFFVGNAVAQFETANGGIIEVKNLEWGTYYFEEDKAPEGYIKSDKQYVFTIDADNRREELDYDRAALNDEDTGAIKLIKENQDGEPMEGVKFALYKDNSRYPDEFKFYYTDSKGEIFVDNLPWGSYFFEEAEVPVGYEAPADPRTETVVINSSTTIQTVKYHELRVNNTEITGYLDVIKVDDNGNKLSGAEFSLQRLVGNDWKKVKLDGDAGHYTYNKKNATPIFTQMLKTDGATLSITELPFGTYRLYEEKSPEGFNKVGSPYEFTIDEQGEHIEYNFVNTPVLADVEFIKVDLETGSPVTGAVFKLYKYDDDSKTSYTEISELRDVKGVFRYEGLGTGDYFVEEFQEPKGYKRIDKKYTFSITEADNGNTVLLDNADRTENGNCYVEEPEEEGKVRLFKADKKTGNALKGAFFDLYEENGKTPIRKDLESDEFGYVRAEGLAWGKYYFIETVAPDNYAKDTNKHWFEVNQDNASAQVEITLDLEGNELRVDNTPIYAGADLIKQDEQSHDEIKGAEFALFYDDGTDKNMVPGYESMKTDADGKISTNLDLKSGKYYFKEINPAPGYVLTDKHYNFTIDETVMNQIVHAGENGIAYNPPIPGEVELLKYYNNENGEKIGLSGAKFALYRERPVIDDKIDVYTTDANGIISVSNLKWGTYYFQEVEAPKGFKPLNLSKDDLKFTIDANNQKYTMGAKLTAENPPLPGKVKLTKYLVEGTKKTTLEGAKFRFYKVASPTDIEIPNTSDPDGLYTSGSDGTIVIDDLKWGSYYFDEVEAPEGCVIPTPSRTGLLTIDASNVEDSIKTPISVDVYNDKVYGNASILKIDDQNNGLKGAEFALYTADGKDVFVTDKGNGEYYYAETGTENKLVSPEGGLIVVKQLPYGDYYFKETKAPATFSKTNGKFEFSITKNQTEDEEPQCKLTCINTPIKAAVEFTKVSTDIEHPLDGCVFELYKDKAAADGSDLFIATVKSDAAGRVYFEDLGPGNYHFKEIETKNNAYKLHDGNLEFVITDADKDTVVGLSNVQGNVVYNPPIPGSIGLEKYYKVGDVRVDKLAGAKFNLYKMDENGKYNIYNTTPYVIPESGVLIVKDLDWTSYYFEEVEAPKGYSFDPDMKYYFTITEADAGNTPIHYIQADNPRNPGKVEIEKVDSTDESKLLSGVTFHLYKNYKAKDQEDLGTKMTKAGKVEWDNLEWGDYTIIEDATIDGYVKNDKEYPFTISESCLGVAFTGGSAIPNPPIQGYFNLEKKDEVSKEPIASVEFELYKVTESGSSLMSEYKLITNAAGKLEDQNGNTTIGPLRKGSYYLKEIVPAGYKDPKEDLSFDITYDGQVKSFSSDYAVYNTPYNGEVVLYKVDENKKPLAGAEFTLYATKPKTVGDALAVLINKRNVYAYGEYKTDENGELHVYDLPWDSYFFMETKAPAGYEIIDKNAEYDFEINAQNCNKTIPIGPIGNPQLKGELEITKVDSLNKNAIQGAKFKLYMVGENGTETDVSATYGATNGVFVTNDHGVINIKDVEWGTYYFDEVESGEGYEPITKKGQVRSKDLVINETNWSDKDKIMLPQKDTVANVKGKGYVMLIKKFDGHKPDPDKIKGIKFDLHNVKTGEVKEFETDENGIIAASTIGALEYGSYYFTEESVPAGSSYKINDFELHFTISRSNPISQPIEYEFTNSEILASAQFIKVDPFEYDYEVPTQKGTIDGIKFFVYKVEAGQPDPVFVTEVTSAEGGIVKVEHLPMGDYYFLEDAESAKALGFVPSTDKYTFTIGENDGPDANGNEKFVDVYKEGELIKAITVPNPKAEGSIRLEKLAKDSSGKISTISLKDAEFELYEESKGMIMGREELAKLNKGDEIVVDKLPWGRYYFKEVTPPKGYALPEGNAANSNTVEIDRNNVSQTAYTPLTCQITDDTVRLYVSKRELMGADELPGAKMSLYNADAQGRKTGSPILEWTSTTTPKLIEIGEDLKDGLEVGKTYVIHEVSAPDGYVVSFDITFTVNNDGSVTTDPDSCRVVGSGNAMTIIVDDGPITVNISKKELGTDVELSGAKLQIKDGNDVIESWSSTGAVHKLSKILVPEKNYILEEVDPPKGYYTAAPITFKISKEGALQIVHDESASASVSAFSMPIIGCSSNPVEATLTMYDRPIKVEISKKRLSGSDMDYVPGAKLTLSEKVGNEYTPVVSWESDGKPYPVEFGLLKVGGEYRVTETAAPKGYTKANDVYFKVKDFNEFEKTDSDGTVTQRVTVFDPPIKVVISKKSITGEDELPGAVLQVVDETGAELAKFTSQTKQTLITSIESAEKLSADEKAAYAKYNVIYNVKFEADKEYTLKELSAPAGYALADPVTFRIDENGNQTPSPVVMKDKPLEIKISKKDIGTGKNLAGAELELYNEADELVAKWTSAEKPVLISIRQIGEAEAADYSEVIAKVLPAGKYRLHEAKAPEGYKLAEDVSLVIDGATVKKDDGTIREESMYDYKDGSTSVLGKKEWIAPKDSEGNIDPDYVYPTITIELYRDSSKKGEMDAKPYKSVKLENGATSFAFGNLERYRTDGNENYEYTYKVVEVMSDEASSQYTSRELEMKKEGDQNTVVFMAGFENILNQEYIDLNGTKTFTLLKDKDGKILSDVKYDDVQIYLLQNGKRVDADEDGKVDFVEIKGGAKETNGVAKFSFKRLPKYDLTTGNAYKYTIEETGSDNYIYNITYTDEEIKINNTPKAKPFKIYGIKTWVDPDNAKRPDVTIQLFRDGKLYRETKLTADNTFTFTDLYEYNLGYGNEEGDIAATADGHKFFYEVKEAGALGYDVEIAGSGEDLKIVNDVATVNIKNTIKQDYIEKSGNKFWNDRGDSSKRPAITVYLLATDSTGRKDVEVDKYVIQNTSSRYQFGTKGQKQLPKYDANGKVIQYRIKEQELPGYLQVINGDDIINTPSKVVVSKLDATEHTELPGAVLSIVRKSDGKEVERWTSGSTPHYIEALEIGEVYTLNEISAPLGYAVASPVDFQVGVNGVEQKVEMFDDPIIGSVTLTKLDASSREKLAGAEFNLYSQDGNVLYATGSDGNYTFSKNGSGVKDLAVDSSGELTVNKMPYGTYYFKEVKAPKGYELKSESISFSITDHGVHVTISYEDPRIMGAVMLTKTNSDETRRLAGAEFELYSRTPKTSGQAAASTVFSDAYYRYGTYTTDSDGKIKVENLPWDDYYFIETKAPEGFTTSRDITGDPLVYTFTIDADNAGTTVVDLGNITNDETESGVLGERVPIAEKVSGVLGVRSKPTPGVLGTRVGPATGDASAIALWLTLLVACVGTIIWMLTSRKKKGLEKQ
ncbi:MAG: Cna B-type domain-containing protein, partial [Lachnospiraceae bacterium]|nr:Cna B-type domain-containing protein [Lachnospiraceae bacterium]